MMDRAAVVKAIYEQDFGCEGRPDGEPARDEVELEFSDTGETKVLLVEDAFLWEQKIQEGSVVIFSENGTLKPALPEKQ